MDEQDLQAVVGTLSAHANRALQRARAQPAALTTAVVPRLGQLQAQLLDLGAAYADPAHRAQLAQLAAVRSRLQLLQPPPAGADDLADALAADLAELAKPLESIGHWPPAAYSVGKWPPDRPPSPPALDEAPPTRSVGKWPPD